MENKQNVAAVFEKEDELNTFHYWTFDLISFPANGL